MTEPLNREIQIPNDYHGQRIDAVLAQLFSEFSRSSKHAM